jgi:hypothetical protein
MSLILAHTGDLHYSSSTMSSSSEDEINAPAGQEQQRGGKPLKKRQAGKRDNTAKRKASEISQEVKNELETSAPTGGGSATADPMLQFMEKSSSHLRQMMALQLLPIGEQEEWAREQMRSSKIASFHNEFRQMMALQFLPLAEKEEWAREQMGSSQTQMMALELLPQAGKETWARQQMLSSQVTSSSLVMPSAFTTPANTPPTHTQVAAAMLETSAPVGGGSVTADAMLQFVQKSSSHLRQMMALQLLPKGEQEEWASEQMRSNKIASFHSEFRLMMALKVLPLAEREEWARERMGSSQTQMMAVQLLPQAGKEMWARQQMLVTSSGLAMPLAPATGTESFSITPPTRSTQVAATMPTLTASVPTRKQVKVGHVTLEVPLQGVPFDSNREISGVCAEFRSGRGYYQPKNLCKHADPHIYEGDQYAICDWCKSANMKSHVKCMHFRSGDDHKEAYEALGIDMTMQYLCSACNEKIDDHMNIAKYSGAEV